MNNKRCREIKWLLGYWLTSALAGALLTLTMWVALWVGPHFAWFVLILKALWQCSMVFIGVMMFLAMAVVVISRLSARGTTNE